MNVHFSSKTDLWSTPESFYQKQNEIYNFTLDPCCTTENRKCEKHYTIDDDGLAQDWGRETVWMNPPYGREIKAWMKKAYESSLLGATVVCLVPSRTDTVWWHEYAMKGEIEFIKGMLKFGDAKNSAPFPSALVVFEASQNHSLAKHDADVRRSALTDAMTTVFNECDCDCAYRAIGLISDKLEA